jgi:hypothetical protein
MNQFREIKSSDRPSMASAWISKTNLSMNQDVLKEHYTRAHAFLAMTCDAASFMAELLENELLGSAVALAMRCQT